MGHYHDHIEKFFPHLNGGLVVYPGSIDLGHNEVISNVEKGFLIVDTSNDVQKVNTNWVKLEKRRPQIEYNIEYSDLSTKIDTIAEEARHLSKKPVLNIAVKGVDIDQRILTKYLVKLEDSVLYYNWNVQDEKLMDNSNYSYDKIETFDMEKEMSVLIKNRFQRII